MQTLVRVTVDLLRCDMLFVCRVLYTLTRKGMLTKDMQTVITEASKSTGPGKMLNKIKPTVTRTAL